MCLGSEREPRLHWSVGCGFSREPVARWRRRQGWLAKCTANIGLLCLPLAKISPLAQSLAAPQKNAFPCAEAREEGGRDHGFPSLSLCSNALLQSNFSFLPLITTTEEEEEEAHKCRGYFQKDALCGLICVVSSRGGRRYILDLLDLQRLVHVVRNCHLVTLNL